jgi:hypothetical protein
VCGGDRWPAGTEPSLDELLSDPIALALRRSDNVTRREVETVMARARQAVARATLAGPVRSGPSIVGHTAVRPAPVEFDFDAEPELTLTE